MKKIVLIQLLILITFVSFGQKSFDLNVIKSNADSDSYNQLLNRYIANDTTLSLDDYIFIYYGHAFRDNFKRYSVHDSVRVLNNYLNNEIDSIDFHKVLCYTNDILTDYPFNIEQVLINVFAYDRLGNKDSSAIWYYKYDKLIRSIMASGDGYSPKTAYIVTKISDEYSLLKAFGLNFSSQSLMSEQDKFYDIMTVEQNQYDIDKLYFDINLFYFDW